MTGKVGGICHRNAHKASVSEVGIGLARGEPARHGFVGSEQRAKSHVISGACRDDACHEQHLPYGVVECPGNRDTADPDEYVSILADLKTRIRETRYRSSLTVNRELDLLYW